MAEEGEDGPALFAAPAAGGHEALPPDPAPQTDGAGSSAAGGSEADASVADNSAAPDEPRSAATAAATASPPAAPVASTASPEQQWAQLLQQLPVADSAPQVVKYLGRHQQSFTRQQLPNGDYCCSVIRRLRDCRRRRRFRHGVCKWLRLQVTCRRALMQATPIVAAELPGGPLQRPLLRMVCVADLDQYICCVTGASQANGLVACEADVFECENVATANYLASELVKACRAVMDLAVDQRRRQAQTAAEQEHEAAENSAASTHNAAAESGKAPTTADAKPPPRQPTPADHLLFASMSVLERAVLQGVQEMRSSPLWRPTLRPRRTASSGASPASPAAEVASPTSTQLTVLPASPLSTAQPQPSQPIASPSTPVVLLPQPDEKDQWDEPASPLMQCSLASRSPVHGLAGKHQQSAWDGKAAAKAATSSAVEQPQAMPAHFRRGSTSSDDSVESHKMETRGQISVRRTTNHDRDAAAGHALGPGVQVIDLMKSGNAAAEAESLVLQMTETDV